MITPDTHERLLIKWFDKFWKLYPRKAGKKAAYKEWLKINPTWQLADNIHRAVVEQKKSPQWNKDNGQYIPHPTTWLHQGRWDDEPIEIDNGKTYRGEGTVFDG